MFYSSELKKIFFEYLGIQNSYNFFFKFCKNAANSIFRRLDCKYQFRIHLFDPDGIFLREKISIAKAERRRNSKSRESSRLAPPAGLALCMAFCSRFLRI